MTTAPPKAGITYSVGRVIGSYPLASLTVVIALVGAGYVWHVVDQRQARTADAARKAQNLANAAALGEARKAAHSKQVEACTAGAARITDAAASELATGDPNIALQILSQCNGIKSDPSISAMQQRASDASVARSAKLAKIFDAEREKAARVDAARRRKEGVSIGMTKDEVRLSSWGKPRKINSTTTVQGTSEQWVYDGGYLYFNGDVLTGIQN